MTLSAQPTNTSTNTNKLPRHILNPKTSPNSTESSSTSLLNTSKQNSPKATSSSTPSNTIKPSLRSKHTLRSTSDSKMSRRWRDSQSISWLLQKKEMRCTVSTVEWADSLNPTTLFLQQQGWRRRNRRWRAFWQEMSRRDRHWNRITWLLCWMIWMWSQRIQ